MHVKFSLSRWQLIAWLIGLLLVTPLAQGANYVVTAAYDCGPGTLYDAVEKANANPGKDTITLASGITEITYDCRGWAGNDSSDNF